MGVLIVTGDGIGESVCSCESDVIIPDKECAFGVCVLAVLLSSTVCDVELGLEA